MLPDDKAASPRPGRWGLAAKLFAILLLLGAVAVLVTSVLGYVQAREALEESIYNQLTTARKSKARQIEVYFRTIRNELSHLAAAKMTIDAARGFVPDSMSWSSPTFSSRSAERSAIGTRRTTCPK